jgi:hypothetical protein
MLTVKMSSAVSPMRYSKTTRSWTAHLKAWVHRAKRDQSKLKLLLTNKHYGNSHGKNHGAEAG